MNLSLDGTGRSQVKTGVGFFDHMLTLLAKHSLIDLTVPRELEIHVFDDQAANPGMNQRAPVLVLARNLTSSANDKVYQDETGQNITRVGPPTVTMTVCDATEPHPLLTRTQ